MSVRQTDNFIAVLRTALGHRSVLRFASGWKQPADGAYTHSLALPFYTGTSQYQQFRHWDNTERIRMCRENIAIAVARAQPIQRFLEVYRYLQATGLRWLFLKGIVCRSLYSELAGYRLCCDEDIFPSAQQAAQCSALLQRATESIAGMENSKNPNRRAAEYRISVSWNSTAHSKAAVSPDGAVCRIEPISAGKSVGAAGRNSDCQLPGLFLPKRRYCCWTRRLSAESCKRSLFMIDAERLLLQHTVPVCLPGATGSIRWAEDALKQSAKTSGRNF